MIQLDLNKKLDIFELKCPETIELQRLIDISKDGIFGIATKKALLKKIGVKSIKLSDLKEMGYDVRTEIKKSEVWWLNTITDTENHEKRKIAMNTEIVGHVRRHETLTGSEIEKIYNKHNKMENSSNNFRYVWLNLNNGKFSCSWGEEHQKIVDEEMLEKAKRDNWKLIKYECINDESFEFYDLMKIVTNTKK